MEKLLGKREKIFGLIAILIPNILYIVKFLITFVKECNLINYLSRLKGYSDINFYNLDYAKVIMIIGICFTITLLLFSFSLLFIKNKSIKKNFIIIAITMVLLVAIFYFVSRYICGDYFTVKMYKTENYEPLYLYDFAYEFHKNAIFMLIS